jgi:hypothetical protein
MTIRPHIVAAVARCASACCRLLVRPAANPARVAPRSRQNRAPSRFAAWQCGHVVPDRFPDRLTVNRMGGEGQGLPRRCRSLCLCSSLRCMMWSRRSHGVGPRARLSEECGAPLSEASRGCASGPGAPNPGSRTRVYAALPALIAFLPREGRVLAHHYAQVPCPGPGPRGLSRCAGETL